MFLLQAVETSGILQQTGLISGIGLIAVAIILIIATVAVLFFVKKFIVNTVLGLIAWAIVVYLLNVNLPFIPSLVVSAVFGPAGVGVMLFLRFFGLV